MQIKDLQDVPPWDWPENAGRQFLQVLTDRQAAMSDRLVAADLAGDFTVISDELADALLTVIGDSSEPDELRATAAIALGPAIEMAHGEMVGGEGEFDDPDNVPVSEQMFRKIQGVLRSVYQESSEPKLVRRRVLEASVRAEEDWHAKAIREAYAKGEHDWVLTAVFAMNYVGGFDSQILESLDNPDPEIHYEAVRAAGNRELEAAWPHVTALVENPQTPKDLLIPAIEAVAAIRPDEAAVVLDHLHDSRDEDIVEAVVEALSMAEGVAGFGDDEFDEDEEDEEK